MSADTDNHAHNALTDVGTATASATAAAAALLHEPQPPQPAPAPAPPDQPMADAVTDASSSAMLLANNTAEEPHAPAPSELSAVATEPAASAEQQARCNAAAAEPHTPSQPDETAVVPAAGATTHPDPVTASAELEVAGSAKAMEICEPILVAESIPPPPPRPAEAALSEPDDASAAAPLPHAPSTVAEEQQPEAAEKQSELWPQQQPELAQGMTALSSDPLLSILPTDVASSDDAAAATAPATNEAKTEEDAEMETAAPIEPLPNETAISAEAPAPAAAAAVAASDAFSAVVPLADPASEAQTEVLDPGADQGADVEPPSSFPFPSLGSPSPSGNPPAPAIEAAPALSSVAVPMEETSQAPAQPLPADVAADVAPAPIAAAADSPTMPALEAALHPSSSPHAQPAQSYATLIRVKLEAGAAVAAPEPTPMETAQTAAAVAPAAPEASRKRKNSAQPASSSAAAAAASSAPRTPSKSQSKKNANGAEDVTGAAEDDGSKGARKKKKTASSSSKSKSDSSAADKENSRTSFVASFARPGSAAATAAAAALAASTSLDFDTLSQTEEAAQSRLRAAEQLRQHNAALAAAQAQAAQDGLSVTGQQQQSQCANECIICQFPYTSHGGHRLCCLKCGHLFGRKCVDHWLSKSKTCPTCKKPSLKSDIRNLFAPSSGVVVADSTHLQGMQDKLQHANMEIIKQKQFNAQLTDDLKKLQARYESIVVAHQSLQQRAMRSNGAKTGETQLTYIMSPTLGRADATAAPSSRPLSPSQFHPITLPLQPPTPMSQAAMLNNLQAAVPRPASITGHPLPAHLPTHPPLAAAPPQPFGTSPTRPSPAQDMARSQSHALASSAAFLHPQGAAAALAPPVASSSAPILPTMLSKPQTLPGMNEMQFPLTQMFSVEGGRVMDFDNANTNLLLSACPPQYASTVANGLTHGVMKLAVSDVSCRYFMPLHSKPIRELRYDARQQLLLSASFDKTLKLSNVSHGSIVASWELPQQAWSAAWNSWNDSYVHVGLQTGELLTFDIRMNQAVPLFSLQLPTKQPVHSLWSIGNPSDPEDCMRGLVAGTSAHVSFWKSSSNLKHWDLHDLPLIPTQRAASSAPVVPSCSSVAVDPVSTSVLCSLRPPTIPAPASIPGANGYTLAKPQSPPMCTVFQLGSDPNAAASSAAASASAAATPATASPPKGNARFTVHVPASNRIAFEVSRVPVPATDVSCSCTAQLTGHRLASALTRSAIFTQTAKGRRSSRLLVAIGDDDSNQCIVWDAATERVLSRLTGQPSAITQVHYSPTLSLMATLSNSTCCLYSTATAAD